jgi:tetratricopeptide (TPR) repeat protein
MAPTPLPDSLLHAEQAPLLGPDAPGLRELLDGLCLSDTDEVAGRALLRRAELRMAMANVAMSRPSLGEPGTQLQDAIEDVTAAGPRLEENTDHELQARLLAGRLLLRTLRPGPASELLHGTRDAVKGKHRHTRLMLALAEGELAIDTEAYVDADRHFRRAVGLARGPGQAHDHYQAAMSVAAAAQLQGNGGGAIPWFRLARATALKFGDQPRQADACFALGNLLMQLDDVLGSLDALEEAVEAGLDPNSQPIALMVLARISLGTGQYAEGVQRAVQAARAGAAVSNAGAFADGSIIAAQCQMGLRQTQTALETLDAGIQVLTEKGFDDLAIVVQAQKQEILEGEGLADQEPASEEAATDEPDGDEAATDAPDEPPEA